MIGISELARRLGVTRRAVARQVGRVIHPGPDGKVDLEVAREAWFSRPRARRPTDQPPTPPKRRGPGRPRKDELPPGESLLRPKPFDTLLEAQTAHENVKVRERELKVRAMERDLVPRRQAEQRVVQLVQQAASMLDQFAADVAPELAAKFGLDVGEVETELETLMLACRNRMQAQVLAQVRENAA